MSKYYNRTKGSIGLTLADGHSISVGPKTFIELDTLLGVSSSLQHHLRTGDLVQMPSDSPEAEAVVVVAAEPASVEEVESIKTEVSLETKLVEPEVAVVESQEAIEHEKEMDLSSSDVSAIDTTQRRRKR